MPLSEPKLGLTALKGFNPGSKDRFKGLSLRGIDLAQCMDIDKAHRPA